MSLKIVSPEDGDVFTTADDHDAGEEGVQIEVEVETVGLTDADEIRLRQNDEVVATQEAAPTMTFVVTLRRGTNNFELLFEEDEYSPRSVELEDTCGEVEWISPSVPDDGEDLLLGGNEEFCGGDQSIDVAVAVGVDDGTDVSLLVNDTAVSETTVQDGIARFDDVTFGMRRRGNDLAVRVSNPGGGETCSPVAFPASIEVDCQGPDCRFGEPLAGLDGALTSDDDMDPEEAGLQARLEVLTDAPGQPVTLVIDGRSDEAQTARANNDGSDAVASFSVSLNNGSRSLVATCEDELGNRTNAMGQVDVDIDPCEIEIVGLEPALDEDGRIIAPTPGESVEATLTVEIDGDDCTELRSVVSSSASCSSVSTANPLDLSPGDAPELNLSYTLDTAGDVFLCAQVRDGNGNNALVSQSLEFFNGTPELVLQLPPDETRDPLYNVEGLDGRIADLNPATAACDASFVVDCEGPSGEDLMGATVELFIDTEVEDPAALASAPCNNGVAVFDSVPLPSRDDGSHADLRARATFAGLDGLSAPLSVQADCRPPTIALLDGSVCGANLRSADDEDPEEDGIQAALFVTNPNFPQRPVEVTVFAESPDNDVSMQTSTDHNTAGTLTYFQGDNTVNFASGGELTVRACTDDAAGNAACDQCETVVGDVPIVNITSPTQGQLLSTDLGVDYVGAVPPMDSSCPGSGDFNIQVQATVDGALAGADNATIQVGANDPVSVPVSDNGTVDDDSDNTIDACVPAAGVDGQSVTVVVRARNEEGYGRRSVTVAVDTQAPEAVSDIAAEQPCRGFPVLSWGDIASSDPTVVGYEVRCSDVQITTQADWDAATVLVEGSFNTSIELNGGSPGDRFRLDPGESGFCTVRAFDQAGAYSPIVPAEDPVEAAPLSQFALADFPAFPGQDVYSWGFSPFAVGDVNGDGLDDFVLAGGDVNTERVFLYLGQPVWDETAEEPVAIEIAAGGSLGFGYAVHSLGNFDADTGGDDGSGTDDFVISTFANPGIAYVITGRATDEWPVAADLNDGGCSADLCILLGEGQVGDFYARHAASAGTFNANDSIPDLALGGFAGQPVLVLGDEYPQSTLRDGTGLCVDARADRSTPAACSTSEGSELARGFRISAPTAGVRGGLATADRNDLYFAAGSSPATLYRVPGRSYPLNGTGLQQITLNAQDAIGSLPSPALVDIVVLGDYNGDGFEDFGVSSVDYSLRILMGTAPNGVLDMDAQIRATNDQPERGGWWGYRLQPSFVPPLGSLADINGDGAAEIVLSAGASSAGAPAGAADLIWGDPDLEVPMSLQQTTRSELVDLSFDSTTIAGAPEPPPSPFPRRIGFVGDFDGDGWNDLVLVEGTENANDMASTRTILVGTCQ